MPDQHTGFAFFYRMKEGYRLNHEGKYGKICQTLAGWTEPGKKEFV